VILLACPFFAVAQSAGTFVSAGNMNAGRTFPRATLLTNGSVLITGYGPVLPTPGSSGADLYNPSTRTFTSIDTPINWVAHSSTLLPDGRVLIAGGYAQGPGGEGSARAYLFDPSTRSFSRTGDMTRSRVGHTATLLSNGKVLLAGGEATRPPFLRDVTADLYDPDSGSFATTGTFVGGGPLVASSTLLPDGKVLVTGYYSGRAAVYDPATESFTPAQGRPQFHQAATLLANGKVLLAGGTDDNGPDAHAETYDPETGSFTPETNMTTPRIGPSVTLLSDGTVLVMGSGLLNMAELYDPDSRVFTPTAEMLVGRYGHSATLLPDGTVLVAGGGCGDCVASATADIYRPAVVRPAAALLSAPGETGSGGAILHAESHQEVTVNNPAIAGEALEIYGSGLIEGSVVAPQVTIGGRLAQVLYFGSAPDVNGVSQVNIRVPAGITAGARVPVRMHYMGRISNEVTLAIR
jgi:WD40 repeat protein